VITYHNNVYEIVGFTIPSLKVWSMFNWWINQQSASRCCR